LLTEEGELKKRIDAAITSAEFGYGFSREKEILRNKCKKIVDDAKKDFPTRFYVKDGTPQFEPYSAFYTKVQKWFKKRFGDSS
jgi:hypothetical protein